MRKFLSALALASLLMAACVSAFAQTPAVSQKADPHVTPQTVLGDVVAVDAKSKQIFVKTDAGSVVIVTVADSTAILRNPPGEKGIAKAVPMTLAEIGAGDRALAMGKLSDDLKTLAGPRRVIVNTKAELLAKQEAERAEWQKRGIVGVVSAVNPATKEITLQTRTPEGPKPMTVAAAGDKVLFRRYAPDSVKFADAKPSTFDELKVGDQLRAKGERGADDATFTPEEVVSGTFQTVVATVTAVDAAKNEIAAKLMPGDKPLNIVVSKDSVLKRIPAEAMAMMGGGGPGGPGGGGQGGSQPRVVVQGGPPPAGAGGQPAGGGPGGPVRRMGFDMAQMLERLPATTVAELKAGDMIVVSSTVGADPTRVTAIQLVAGVEPIMAMMAARRAGGQGGMPGGAGAGNPAASLGFGFGIGQP